MDRPTGIRIGDRMTLRPYVSLSVTYDSNVNGSSGGANQDGGDVMWTIGPTLGLAYNADSWSLLLNGFYSYHQYTKSENSHNNQHTYGEDLRLNWSSSVGSEKGWSFILGESYQRLTMADDSSYGGTDYDNDTQQFQFSAAMQRRFNESVHGDVNASYYWLDYLNDLDDNYSNYGWSRCNLGAEAGYAPSRWFDMIISGTYSDYRQDNSRDITAGNDPGVNPNGRRYGDVSDDSEGYTVQIGVGSYMTDRISYRVLGGWSRFEYADAMTDDGFVYTITANWKIGETWNTMLMATSYYQPSERQMSSSTRTDAVSWGLAKVMVRGKLRGTLDLRYNRQTTEYAYGDVSEYDYDYTLDRITARLGLSYTLNRFLSVYSSAEYEVSMNDHASERNDAYDYDRYRLTLGMSLTY